MKSVRVAAAHSVFAGLAVCLAASAAAHPGHDPKPGAPDGARAPAAKAAAVKPVSALDPAAERCIRAFLAMYNDLTAERVRTFEEEFASAERRARSTVDERVKLMSSTYARSGAVTLGGVLTAAPAVAVVAIDSASDGALTFEFQFSETEAGRLDAVLIAPAAAGQAAMPLDKAGVAEVVEAAAKAMESRYVFPEVGAKMAALVRQNLRAGAYDAIGDETSLNRRLTADLRSVSKDKHIGLMIAPAAEGSDAGPPMDEMKARNFGFVKAEALPGGVGYLRFDVFLDLPEARQVAAGALAFLANSRALIFDLRSNGGGSPAMIRYITSSLFAERTHLNDMVNRDGAVEEQYWTFGPDEASEAPPTRFDLTMPVFVLTSRRTFSGAEEFSYSLKNLGRATIVGETTGGGAHPIDMARLNGRLALRVPYMRARNPITGANWEGAGVKPDVDTPADQALDKALDLARAALAASRAAAK